jgi:hypothetical protein
MTEQEILELQEQLQKAENKSAKLEKALKVYADFQNWSGKTNQKFHGGWSNIDDTNDGWWLAEKTLKEIDEN